MQLVQHNSLDAAYKGFKEGLAEEGYKEGDNLTIDYQNAQNNQDNLKSMSEKLVKEDPDLLLGIATPAAQSLLNETTTIPMTVTAVTDLEQAHLVTSMKTWRQCDWHDRYGANRKTNRLTVKYRARRQNNRHHV